MEKLHINEVESTSRELLQLIDSFQQDEFNKVPFEGSWTPGQVTEHIYLSVSGILKALNGRTAPTHRDPGQMVAPLSDAFLDFSTKMKSPDFILPSEDPKDKKTSLQTMADTWKGIEKAANTEELELTCLDFEMPTVGTLTRLEWLNFAVVHTQRHIWQLKKIAATMGVAV